LPRTILEADEDTEVLVLEMGLAVTGDIKRLADIARPDIAAITNIGIAHRENFDTDDGILKAKYEITSFMDKDSTLVIDAGGNGESREYAEKDQREKGYKLINVAAKGTPADNYADYVVSAVRVNDEEAGVSDFEIFERGSGVIVSFSIPLPGAFAGINTAQAIAVSKCACEKHGLTIRLTDAAEALRGLVRTPHRLEPIIHKGILVIDDTYNASPDSAKAGLDYLKNVPAKKRIAVLGDMNELGDLSEDVHKDIGEAAAAAGADIVYAYGQKAKKIAEGAGEGIAVWFDENDKNTLIGSLLAEVKNGDVVYIKGSRSMKMEEVVTALTEDSDGVYQP
jgi:UDP-N-acetylmuramoyl-tripeptide--D-alanyl-D-alanine ligase